MVCAITLPDVVYIYLSYSLNSDIIVVSSCLFIEQFGYGLGFTVLTLYMLFYSQGKFKTSHYSICTGISYLGLMLPGMVSGYLKDMVGYRLFFIIVMACCAITFLVTAFLKIDPESELRSILHNHIDITMCSLRVDQSRLYQQP